MKVRYVLMVLIITGFCTRVWAQGREVPVEVIVDKISYKHIRGFLERTTEAVYKLYHTEISQANYLADKGCLRLVSRDADKNLELAADPVLGPFRKMRPFNADASGVIKIIMESFKDNKGDPCGYDKGDHHYSVTSLEVKVADLNPGVYSAPYTLLGKDGKMSAEIRIRYGIPLPAPISHKDHLAVNDVTKVVELASSIALENTKNLDYQWEYQSEGMKDWKAFDNRTVSPSVVFFPIRDVFKNPIKINQLLHLRMKVVSPELSSEYVSTELTFTPEAPQFDTTGIVLVPSCPNNPSGAITINNPRGVAAQFAYYVIRQKTMDTQHYPDVIAATDQVKSGKIKNGENINAAGFSDGDYTIVVYNADMKVGNVFRTHAFTIAQYPSLTIKSTEVKDATCSNTPDGQIMVEAAGGNPAKLTYLLSPAAGKLQSAGRVAVFTELVPGTYTVVVRDACGQLISSKDLDVAQKVALIRGKIVMGTEAVGEFSNGAVQVTLEGGSGKFKYSVAKNNITLVEKEVTSGSFTIERLAKGNYHLKVVDPEAAKCPGWDTVFTVTAKMLTTDTAANTMPNAQDTGVTKKDRTDFSTMTVTPEYKMGMTIRKAVFNQPAGKNITSFASYIQIAPAQKKYYIIIEKSRFEMRVYNAMDSSLIVMYPVVFGNDDQGDKMTENDRKTPEGIFHIIAKKPHEKWGKFLALDYPTEESMTKFLERKAKGLIPADARIGSDIGLHGTWQKEDAAVDAYQNWTSGCVCTKNEYIEELYTYIPVGTKVIIKK